MTADNRDSATAIDRRAMVRCRCRTPPRRRAAGPEAAAPATDELIYAWHEHGFALYSMRSPTVSRSYLEVPLDEDIARWPDERIWEELQLR